MSERAFGILDSQPGTVKNTERLEDGRLLGEAVVTRTGVFPYRQPDGSFIWVCKHPDDVFDEESLRSLALVPLTNEHPELRLDSNGEPESEYDGFVHPNNAERLQIGSIGNTYRIDGDCVWTPFTATHAEAIQDIEAGKCGLSAGAKALLVEEAGEFRGVKYTHRHKRIRYNHVAVVNSGRVGPKARIALDSFPIDESKLLEGTRMKTKIVLDNGVEYEADAEVVAELKKVRGERVADGLNHKTAIEGAEKAKKDAEDALTEEKRLHGLTKTALDEAPKKAAALLKARAKIMEKAAHFLDAAELTDLEDKSDVEVMKKTILSEDPDADLKNVSDEFVKGLFGGLKVVVDDDEEVDVEDEEDEEEVEVNDAEDTPQRKAKTPIGRQRETVITGRPGASIFDGVDADAERAAMLTRHRDMGKKKKG